MYSLCMVYVQFMYSSFTVIGTVQFVCFYCSQYILFVLFHWGILLFHLILYHVILGPFLFQGVWLLGKSHFDIVLILDIAADDHLFHSQPSINNSVYRVLIPVHVSIGQLVIFLYKICWSIDNVCSFPVCRLEQKYTSLSFHTWN